MISGQLEGDGARQRALAIDMVRTLRSCYRMSFANHLLREVLWELCLLEARRLFVLEPLGRQRTHR